MVIAHRTARFVVTGVTAVLVSVLFAGIGCSSSSPEPTAATSDADAAAEAASQCATGDRCCIAVHAPGVGRACSPTAPCDAPLDCVYEPGCVDPKGTCQWWGSCNDSGILETFCLCDGGTGHTRSEPMAGDGGCAP